MNANNQFSAIQIQGITATDLINQIINEVKKVIPQTQQPEPVDKLMTRQEVSKYLGVSIVTVHHWTKSGILIAYRIGNKVRYKESEVLQALQSTNIKK